MEVQEQESVGRWDGLSSRDATSRIETMENIQQVVMKKIEAIKPMPPGAFSPSAVGSPPNSDLNAILAHLLMLSKRCPFEDVRALSGQLLRAAQDLGVRIPRPLGNGPSRFIPEKEILKVSKVADRTQSIFEDAFSTLGRLDNISVVMGFHPHYLESFLRTQHYLLQMDGPLSLHYRHYIGIMAAARHQCSYLVNLHVNDFLQVGGDPKWLNGLDEAPRKLQPLGELNKILAHRPWLLTKEHIEVSGWARSEGCSRSCVKVAGAAAGPRRHRRSLIRRTLRNVPFFFPPQQLVKAEEHSWSLAELIHAVVLLTHYHSLASFTFGCGIMPEIHSDGGHTFRPPSLSQYCVCDIANGNGHANHHDDPLGNQVSDGTARARRVARGRRCPDPLGLFFFSEGDVRGGGGADGAHEAAAGVPRRRGGQPGGDGDPLREGENREHAGGHGRGRGERPLQGHLQALRGPQLRLQGVLQEGGAGAHAESAGLQLGGPRLLPGQQTLPRCRADAGREVPVGVQPHLQHHGDAQRCGHQHVAPSHLELHPLHVRHQIRRLRLRGDQPAPGPWL
uniref:Sestrin 1 n=1 Tax=Takifugu rubripes TaxID=31033 RepID=A0A674MGK0_TAKRU